MPLTATFDPSADALYLRRGDRVEIRESVELESGIVVDLGQDGASVGVELLGATQRGVPISDLARALGGGVEDQEVANVVALALRERQSG